MHRILLSAFIFLTFQSTAFGFLNLFGGDRTTFEVEMGGDVVEISAEVSEPEFQDYGNGSSLNHWSVYLEDVEVNIIGQSHSKLYLKAEFGWGDSPLGVICEAVSRQLDKDMPYAEAYGGYGTLSAFSSPTFFVVQRDGSYKISDIEPNGQTYIQSFSCDGVELQN